MALIARALAPHGVAFVSYNALPGARLRTMLREMVLLHAGDGADRGERVARGRELYGFLAPWAEDRPDAYGAVLASELGGCAGSPPRCSPTTTSASATSRCGCATSPRTPPPRPALPRRRRAGRAAGRPPPAGRGRAARRARRRRPRRVGAVRRPARRPRVPPDAAVPRRGAARRRDRPGAAGPAVVRRARRGGDRRRDADAGPRRGRRAAAPARATAPPVPPRSRSSRARGRARWASTSCAPRSAAWTPRARRRAVAGVPRRAARAVRRRRARHATAAGERPEASPVARWQAARGPELTNLRHDPVRLDDPLGRSSSACATARATAPRSSTRSSPASAPSSRSRWRHAGHGRRAVRGQLARPRREPRRARPAGDAAGMTGAALYAEVPYSKYPYVQTHPDRLATLGVLHGLRPAAPAAARVLELGLRRRRQPDPDGLRGARRCPRSASTTPATPWPTGRATAAALGLENVTLHVADVRELEDGSLGVFDYVIAHGVYGWVAPDVRDALLAAIAAHLAPQGIAFVSYPAYPGGYFRRMLREMGLFHARAAAPGRGARGGGARAVRRARRAARRPRRPVRRRARARAAAAALPPGGLARPRRPRRRPRAGVVRRLRRARRGARARLRQRGRGRRAAARAGCPRASSRACASSPAATGSPSSSTSTSCSAASSARACSAAPTRPRPRSTRRACTGCAPPRPSPSRRIPTRSSAPLVRVLSRHFPEALAVADLRRTLGRDARATSSARCGRRSTPTSSRCTSTRRSTPSRRAAAARERARPAAGAATRST